LGIVILVSVTGAYPRILLKFAVEFSELEDKISDKFLKLKYVELNKKPYL
jgi:hypothetical protein